MAKRYRVHLTERQIQTLEQAYYRFNKMEHMDLGSSEYARECGFRDGYLDLIARIKKSVERSKKRAKDKKMDDSLKGKNKGDRADTKEAIKDFLE